MSSNPSISSPRKLKKGEINKIYIRSKINPIVNPIVEQVLRKKPEKVVSLTSSYSIDPVHAWASEEARTSLYLEKYGHYSSHKFRIIEWKGRASFPPIASSWNMKEHRTLAATSCKCKEV